MLIKTFWGLNLKCTLSSQKTFMNLKRTKGTNTNIDDDKSKHEDYKKILLNGASMRHEMNRIQTKFII